MEKTLEKKSNVDLKGYFLKFFQSFLYLVPTWIALYSIIDKDEFTKIVQLGLVIIIINSVIIWLKTKKAFFFVNNSWLWYAGAILLVFHTGNTNIAIVLSICAILLGLLFTSVCDAVVGISLLLYIIL